MLLPPEVVVVDDQRDNLDPSAAAPPGARAERRSRADVRCILQRRPLLGLDGDIDESRLHRGHRPPAKDGNSLENKARTAVYNSCEPLAHRPDRPGIRTLSP